MAWMLPAVSAGSSILGGLMNRPRDPMQDWQRAWQHLSGITMGAENPLQFAQNAYGGWMGSPAYQGMQRNLFNQSQSFGNALQSSLANRGLLNSGLGNVMGSLGQNLYGGNLAQLQGSQWQNFFNMAPQMFALRGNLAGGIGPQRPSFSQGLGAGLQGLGGFGLNYLAMKGMMQPGLSPAQQQQATAGPGQPGYGGYWGAPAWSPYFHGSIPAYK